MRKRKMRVSQQLIEQLKKFEGLRLEAYTDAAGVPTIGYGHTGNVRMGDRITEYWAEVLLKEDVEQVEQAVRQLGAARTEGQFDALVSFAFNLGTARLANSTLLRYIYEGRPMRQIRHEFMRWVYAGGKRQRGLVIRREWEASRFFESEQEPVRPFDVEW